MKKYIVLTLCMLVLGMNIPIFAIDNVQTNDVNIEHLQLPKKLQKKTPTDVIKASVEKNEIVSYNTVEMSFGQDFNSKYAKVGDTVEFILDKSLNTKEGTEVLPVSTKLVAEISNVEKPKAFNQSGKVYLDFKYLELPDGTKKDIKAKVFAKKDFLYRGKMNALGKGLGSTLGGMAIGTAAGCGIGIAAGAVIVGGFAIGMPVGFAVGAAAGLMTPGLYYKAKAGDKIDIQLLDTVIIEK